MARMMPLFLQLLLVFTPAIDCCVVENDETKSAELLSSSIDDFEDPCTDFYEFTCANWINQHPIPADEESTSVLDIDRWSVRRQLRELLESKQRSSSRAINDAKLLYSACMNTTRINDIGSGGLLRNLEALGYWPIIHGNLWREHRFNLTRLLIGMGRTTRQSVGLFNFYIMADSENGTRNVAYFDQASLPLIREYYLQPEYSEKLAIYTRYLTKKVSILAQECVLCDARLKPKQVAKDVRDVVAFEKQLAAILTPEADHSTQHLFDYGRLSDMHKLVPQSLLEINWLRYLRAVMPTIARNYLSTNPKIMVLTAYFEQLSKLLKGTNTRTLTNYLLLRYTSFWADDLGDDYDAVEAEYVLEMTGAELQPRWKICTATVLEGLPQAVGALYVRHHFNETSQARVVGVVTNILEAFRAMIVESELLDPRTKRHALQKVDALEITIGFTRMHFDDSEVDKYHDGINLTRLDTFTTMKAKLANFAMLKSVQRLLGPVDRTEFHVSPAEANGYYDPTKNAMFLLAASLQPYVEDDLPSFYTYATLGAYVGHEIAHAFDDAGILYDKVGNLNNWLSNDAFAQLSSRTECFVDEYSLFVVDEIGMNLNGRLTLGENIADNVALKASFRAFSALNRHSSIAPTELDGYTPQQSFFLSYGYSWCSSMRLDAARRQILTDTHSLEKFRVNGVVMNSPEFADAFGCPLGTPMNPRNKCTLW